LYVFCIVTDLQIQYFVAYTLLRLVRQQKAADMSNLLIYWNKFTALLFHVFV